MSAGEIAKGLTKAQRAMLADDYGATVETYPPARKLIDLGLANGRYTAMGSYRLVWTPLGLEVRAHLQETPGHE